MQALGIFFQEICACVRLGGSPFEEPPPFAERKVIGINVPPISKGDPCVRDKHFALVAGVLAVVVFKAWVGHRPGPFLDSTPSTAASM